MITPERMRELQGHMPDDQWEAFYAKCVENGVPINDESLEYGSVFIAFKYWFSLGWEANVKGR